MTVTLNQIYDKFQFIADSHGQIKDFMIAQAAEVSADRATTYPLLMVLELPYSIVQGARQHRFRFMVMDRLYSDNPGSNRREVLSDCHSIALDVMAKLRQERDLWAMDRSNMQLESFEGRFLDDVAGWSFDVGLNVAYDWNACQVPGNLQPPLPPSPPSERAAAPTFTLAPGIYPLSASVGIVTNEPSGTIYFTQDGTTPNSQDDLYISPTTIFGDAIFQARVLAPGKLPSPVATASYGITGAQAFIDPSGGTFSASGLPSVSIVSNLIGAAIYYTLDGSVPTSGSTLYVSPITIDRNRVLKAIAVLNPYESEAPSEASFSVVALPPTLDTTTGTYISSRTVTATNPNPLGTIQYRLDGGSWINGSSVTVDVTRTIDWRVIDSDYVTSNAVSVVVTIKCAAPSISPSGGVFEGTQSVSIVTNEPGGTTHYTTDGTIPDQTDPTSTPFNITASTQVRARTFRSGCEPSDTITTNFTRIEPVILLGDSDSSSGGNRLYRSIDNAASWQELQPFGNVDGVYGISCLSQDATKMLVAALVSSAWNVAVSNDFGTSWQTPNFGGALTNVSRIQGSADGTKYIAVVNIGGGLRVFVSTDSGLTFTQRNPIASTEFNNCAISPDGSVMYATRLSGGTPLDVVYRSTDNGLNWSVVVNASIFTGTSFIASNTRLYYILSSDALIRSILHTSTSIVTGANAGAASSRLGVSYNDERLVAASASGANQVRVSSNQGTSFSVVTLPVTLQSDAVVCNANGQRIIIGGSSNNVVRSTDGGANFNNLATRPAVSGARWSVANGN